MPKQPITQPSYSVTNIQQLPPIVEGQATNLQATFDKVGKDTRDYLVSVTAELNASDGSKKIGHQSTNITSDNVADALEEVITAINDVTLGDIPNNSLTNAKLATDIKVGSLATLTTVAKDSVTNAINELDQDMATNNTAITTVSTNLDIARIAKLATGSVNAFAVDTDGTFDLAKNGNVLTFIPNLTTTSATPTIAVDGQAAKSIKKANDIGNFVNLEAGDIKKNVPTQLVWDSVSDFFIFAPKGGSNIKSIQYINYSTSSETQFNIPISSVDKNKSIVYLYKKTTSGNASVDSWSVELLSNTIVQVNRSVSVITAQTLFVVVVEYNNVKSRQEGTVTFTTETTNVTITIANASKTILSSSMFTPTTSSVFNSYNSVAELTTNTNLLVTTNTSASKTVKWQILEFN